MIQSTQSHTTKKFPPFKNLNKNSEYKTRVLKVRIKKGKKKQEEKNRLMKFNKHDTRKVKIGFKMVTKNQTDTFFF